MEHVYRAALAADPHAFASPWGIGILFALVERESARGQATSEGAWGGYGRDDNHTGASWSRRALGTLVPHVSQVVSCVAGADRPDRGGAGRHAPAPPLRIIVVDDNPVDVQLIRWVLEAHALSYELQVIDHGDGIVK